MIAGTEGRHLWTPAGLVPAAAVTLNNRTVIPRYAVSRIGGIKSLGDVVDVREDNTGKRGETTRSGKRSGKTLTYEGDIHARTLATLTSSEDALLAAFDETDEGRMDVTSPITGGVAARYFLARALACVITTEPQRGPLGYKSSFVITMRMGDPRVFSPTQLGPFSTGTITGGAGFTLPVSIPFTMPAGTNASSTVVVNNTGKCESDPFLTLKGPGRHPQVKNLTLGLTLQFVDLDLGGGDVTVDFAKRRVIHVASGDDISSQIEAATSDWWDADAPGLAPGNNTLQFTADALASPAIMEVRFNPADPA